ncbi:hypothetical protein NC651_010790 [Populus alba x Populus x berolinensis]|nr:hypothetical protein NC651_010790 [Populus alba x Populus x berolinensis]
MTLLTFTCNYLREIKVLSLCHPTEKDQIIHGRTCNSEAMSLKLLPVYSVENLGPGKSSA